MMEVDRDMAIVSGQGGRLDSWAVTISGLCIVHCLALPVAALWLPLAGSIAEVEWIHKLLVLIAIPVSSLAFLRRGLVASSKRIVALAATGFGLMLAAAFIRALHDFETVLTVSGALMVACAHIWRWKRHRHYGHTGRLNRG